MNLHDVLEHCLERLAGVLEDARYEQRDGYTFLAFPTFPVRDLNGMWVDSDAAVAQIEALGLKTNVTRFGGGKQVHAQNPSGGTKVRKGTVVRLLVY